MQANKAIVGRNAFAHESGIHQDGMLKDRRTYEIMTPRTSACPKTTLVLGKHSGRHAVQKRCEDSVLRCRKFELDQVYRQMTELADLQKHVTDAETRRRCVESGRAPARTVTALRAATAPVNIVPAPAATASAPRSSPPASTSCRRVGRMLRPHSSPRLRI